MRANVISSTKEGYINIPEDFKLAGKIAGMCYMKGSFSDEKVSGDKAGLNRAYKTAKSGHHSVFDHITVTLEITDISKIAAMVLNSLRWYTTSEKSGRYTEMSGQTDLEVELYNKWKEIFKQEIKKCYTSKSDTDIDKLANENARYILSVFTPTSMIYTTTLTQWNYIKQWCDNAVNELRQTSVDDKGVSFKYRLSLELENISKIIVNCGLYIPEIQDKKNRGIEFIRFDNDEESEYYGDVFKAVYEASFVQLAQSHRHRTLKHVMKFEGYTNNVYVPKIIQGTSYENEWLSDIAKVKDLIPQCTLVTVIETGNTDDYVLKLQERLCGRAQIETMMQTKETLLKMLDSKDLNFKTREKLSKFIDKNGNIVPRCNSGLFKCSDGCTWDINERLNRKA